MMNDGEQLTIYDSLRSWPPMWDCRKTCKRFGEKIDHPSWWPKDDLRCLLPDRNTMQDVVFDNTAVIYCTLYEKK